MTNIKDGLVNATFEFKDGVAISGTIAGKSAFLIDAKYPQSFANFLKDILSDEMIAVLKQNI